MLKGVANPLFKESIAEPFDETSILIQEEIRTEDILSQNVQQVKHVPKCSVKVVNTPKTNLDTGVRKNNNCASTSNNMPTINVLHKACGVANCMSCAFNVMSAYFNSKHASDNKTAPR